MRVGIQNITGWLKRHWFLSAILLVLLSGGYQIYIWRNGDPFKVTNPDDPRFDPLRFEVRDYRGNPELLSKAMKKAMPQGASLSQIQTMYKNDDPCFIMGRILDKPGKITFGCDATSIKYPTGGIRIFWFDENDKLVDYFAGGVPGLHTGKRIEEIWPKEKN